MLRAFIDSSVFFSACFSPRGASRAILTEGVLGTITLVVSEVVLAEVRANLSETSEAWRLLEAFEFFLRTIPFEEVQATNQEVEAASNYTELKDAAIVSAAKHSNVDYLVSLDRKHLVGVTKVARQSGLRIILPGDFLARLRAQ